MKKYDIESAMGMIKFMGVSVTFFMFSLALGFALMAGKEAGREEYRKKQHFYATTSEVQILDRIDAKIKKEVQE